MKDFAEPLMGRIEAASRQKLRQFSAQQSECLEHLKTPLNTCNTGKVLIRKDYAGM